ncbi:helix-turn-helix transcriptional regulator [Pantoea brenneri]|uniref:helix-turn-helix domain-containing protein n=1 Tax=Pantoea brenneri TaxID=472694 RepID=UPI002449837A|nr:helix-turn-helix transcriptional regulator [Pantoea brenneri]MDH1088853.1 helix-turn-helix transcriptional regulator [Pantoea brenneri]
MPSIYPNDYRALIAMLVRARKAKQITQVQLAAAMRVPQSLISKAERGERRLDVVELLRMCELLDVPITTLISIIPPRFSPVSTNKKPDA